MGRKISKDRQCGAKMVQKCDGPSYKAVTSKALRGGRAINVSYDEDGRELAAAAGDGGDYQDLVIVFEVIFLVAEEADVFFVDIEVDEAADLAVFAAEVLAEGRELVLDLGDQFRKIGGRGRDFADVVGVLLKCVGQQDSNGHNFLPAGSEPD
jgi:hypothetical protein